MSARRKVLITDRFAPDSLAWLQSQPNLEITRSAHHGKLEAHEILGAHGWLIRSRTIIDEKLLSQARQLQVIVTATSGFDHIDLEAARRWGITVMHTPTANIESAAQLTWALVLACAQRLPEARELMARGDWNRDLLTGLELSGRTYGIVGLGRIGRRVARLAQAFGMNVIAHDPYQDEAVFEALNVTRTDFESLLRQADVASFHVPKTLETDLMLRPEHLAGLTRPLILVNSSRGSIVAAKTLLDGLSQGQLRAVGLDVFEEEPLPATSPLLAHPRAVLSPHIGANTEDAFYKASQIAAQKLVAFFLDGSTSDSLPPRVPWYGATPLKPE